MQDRRGFFIRVGILTLVIGAGTAGLYLEFYRPMIEDIFTFRDTLRKQEQELAAVTANAGTNNISVKTLTEEEKSGWREIQTQIYRKFPPPEVLPKYLTFHGSTSVFYGEGESLQQKIPSLFLELAQAMLSVGGKELNIVDVTPEKGGLTIPPPEGGGEIKALELKESAVTVTVSDSFQRIGEFLGQLNNLHRLIMATRIVIKSEKEGAKAAITVKTYHCQEGALGDVPE